MDGRHRWGHLVDQVAALHLETLGVPVRWESWPDDQPKSFREELMFHAADIAGAAVLGLTRQIHHDRAAEPVKAGVVFGAAHMPAVAAHLCGQLGYIASSADWLIVAHARSLPSQG